MKKVPAMFALTLTLVGCGGADNNKEFDNKALFDADGYLSPSTAKAYREEMPCLDADRDGRVSRAEWNSFMDYWRTRTPHAGKTMCSQMPESKSPR